MQGCSDGSGWRLVQGTRLRAAVAAVGSWRCGAAAVREAWCNGHGGRQRRSGSDHLLAVQSRRPCTPGGVQSQARRRQEGRDRGVAGGRTTASADARPRLRTIWGGKSHGSGSCGYGRLWSEKIVTAAEHCPSLSVRVLVVRWRMYGPDLLDHHPLFLLIVVVMYLDTF